MGSEEAYNILKEMGENEYANYDTQMAKVRTEISCLAGGFVDAKPVLVMAVFVPAAAGGRRMQRYPAFMRTQAWARKDIHTALGSWTELKHDTILYAKQVMAEMGGGGPEETSAQLCGAEPGGLCPAAGAGDHDQGWTFRSAGCSAHAPKGTWGT